MKTRKFVLAVLVVVVSAGLALINKLTPEFIQLGIALVVSFNAANAYEHHTNVKNGHKGS